MVKERQILILGSGNMAKEYMKVISQYEYKVVIISNSNTNFDYFKSNYKNISTYIKSEFELINQINFSEFSFAINCVSIENLFETTKVILQLGIKKILLEKPGSLLISDLDKLIEIEKSKNAQIYIALNRRFHSSTIFIKNLLKSTKASSASFDFTEWKKGIDPNKYNNQSLNKWLYCNSIHVIDLFFYIFGNHKEINSTVMGVNKLNWHPSSSIFYGTGILENDIPFSYKSDWNGPGRWGIELVTETKKYILSPLEKVQELGLDDFIIRESNIDYKDDEKFKPGLKKMIDAFIKDDLTGFNSLEDQKKLFKTLNKIGGYKEN